MKIVFDVEDRPPRKSQWGKEDAHLIIKLRESALNARKAEGISKCFDGEVKLKLILYAQNISEINYKQTGDDDLKKFVGDLDSLIAGVCEYLQPAPTNPGMNIHSDLKGKDGIGHLVPLIIENDSQIVEINATKVLDERPHYHVEVETVSNE